MTAIINKAREMFYRIKKEDEAVRYAFKPEIVGAVEPIYNAEIHIYEALSDVIHQADTDTDSAYKWTVEVLNALDEILDYCELEDEDEIRDQLTEYAHSYTPVYTHKILDWFSSHVSNVNLTEDTMQEYGINFGVNDDYTLIDLMRAAYARGWEQHALRVYEAMLELDEGGY